MSGFSHIVMTSAHCCKCCVLFLIEMWPHLCFSAMNVVNKMLLLIGVMA